MVRMTSEVLSQAACVLQSLGTVLPEEGRRQSRFRRAGIGIGVFNPT